MPTAVELQEVSKSFGSTVAVHQLSLQVEEGEFLCLLGPSGCGKTTLLRMIAGLESPSAGHILIDQQIVTDVPPYDREIALVFQTWALFPHRTVAENVGFGLKMQGVPKGERRRRVGDYLNLVQLDGLEDRYPSQMSGGQQQRAALARALIVEPKVLLMDEPLSNLDLKLRQKMRFELREIHHRLGLTTIFVTHDQIEALEMSDQVAVMNHGELVQLGSPSNVYNDPRSAFVADFVGETNLISGRARVTGEGYSYLETAGGLTIALPRSPLHDDGHEVSVCVRPEKVQSLKPHDEMPENCFTGVVHSRLYRGPVVRIVAEVTPKLTLAVDVPSEDAHVGLAEGSPIILGWNPEDSVCLPDRNQEVQGMDLA